MLKYVNRLSGPDSRFIVGASFDGFRLENRLAFCLDNFLSGIFIRLPFLMIDFVGSRPGSVSDFFVIDISPMFLQRKQHMLLHTFDHCNCWIAFIWLNELLQKSIPLFRGPKICNVGFVQFCIGSAWHTYCDSRV